MQQPSAFMTTTRNGWLTFAGVMVLVTGGLNIIDGFVALYRTRFFRADFLIGDLRTWAYIFIAFGALQIAAGLAILAHQGWGRWFALAMVSINALGQLFVISSYPFYAVVIIAYDVAIFYALSVHWQRRVTTG